MQLSSRPSHLRRQSLTSTIQSTILKYSHPSRRTHLGKFSTSNLDELTDDNNSSSPPLDQFQQITTQQFNDNTPTSPPQPPYIDSKLINSIFPSSERLNKSGHRKNNSTTGKYLSTFKFHEKDKVLNDYVVTKLKTIINRKQGEQEIGDLSRGRLEQYYSTFLETFSITELKKVFQCLETNRAITLSKEYILNQLYQYYFTKTQSKTQKKQTNQNILEIKMNANLIKNHEANVLRTKDAITNLLNYKKQIKRVSTLETIETRTTRFKHYENIIDQEVRVKNSELVKQTETINRLQRSENNLKKSMCKKVDLLLGSAQYSPNGFGELYHDFIENKLDERVFSVFLGPKEMQFLRGKIEVERQISELERSCLGAKVGGRRRVKNEISKLKNQLIVMEEDVINKLKNDRHLEKNVYSLFGCGERGKGIVERVRLNSPLKS